MKKGIKCQGFKKETTTKYAMCKGLMSNFEKITSMIFIQSYIKTITFVEEANLDKISRIISQRCR